MAKGHMPAALVRANGIRALQTSGYSETEAIAIIDRKSGGGSPPRRGHGETIVPTSDGTGVRQAGRAGRLYAAIEGHTLIAFDQGAIAAFWQGLITALRTGGAVDVSQLFPDPCAVGGVPQAGFAQEREIGAEMAKMIGLALKALEVTPEEWALWYAKSANVRIRHGADCGCGCNNSQAMVPSGGQVQGWGSPFGPPTFNGGSSGAGGAGTGG